MKKPIPILFLTLSLQGCAGLTAYIHAHAPQIAAFSMVAGAIATGEQAAINAINLEEKITK